MAQHFINRKEELDFLRERYSSKQAEFIVLYGRRRIGKTELAVKFSGEAGGVYYLSTKEGDATNIQNLSVQMAAFLGDEAFSDAIYPDWFGLFSAFLKHAHAQTFLRKKKIVIVIDEFPYLIDGNAAIPSVFQKLWDLLLKKENIMLILSGSSVSTMETEVLDRKSPLYGRRTGQWRLLPMDFPHLGEFLPRYGFEDLVRVWFVIGGIPAYLERFSDNLGFFENLREKILRKGAYLYEETDFLLNTEFKEPKNYKRILKVISLGNLSFGKIANAAMMDKGMLSKYLDVLDKLGIIEYRVPITATERSKKGIYIIKDPYLNFWFRYVYSRRTDLEALKTAAVLKYVKSDFSKYSGRMFERFIEDLIRRGHLLEQAGLERLGGWWHGEEEIDIVGLNEEEKKILFGECKWSEKVDAAHIIAELRRKGEFVDWHKGDRDEYYAVFAKSFKNKFKEKNVLLFDLKDLEKLIGGKK